MTVEVNAARTHVTYFRIEYQVVCAGASMEGHTESTSSWALTDRQFTISLSTGVSGRYDTFTGLFNPGFTAVDGTWLKWLVEWWPPPAHTLCSDEGTWSASP